MKKVFAMLLAAVLLLSLAACAGTTGGEDKAGDGNSSTDKIDMSRYPEDLDEWSGQDFIDYFKEAGVFTDGSGFETWIQDHAVYWPETPVNECAGWWSDDDTVLVMIFILSGDNPDTSEEQLTEWKDSVKENQAFPGDYASLPIDHLVGNVAFAFESTILDDDIYDAFCEAYQELLESMNVTPEV